MSLVELAIGRYPIPPPTRAQLRQIFGDDYDETLDADSAESGSDDQPSHAPLSIFALLDYIVMERPPSVPLGTFSVEFKDFIDSCLRADPNQRPDMSQLMV